MSHAEYMEQLQQDVGRVAAAALSGNLDNLEACWLLGPLLAQAELSPDDLDANAIGQVCSELDALPIGEARALWSSHTLGRLAPELEALKSWALPLAMPAIQSAAARFGI